MIDSAMEKREMEHKHATIQQRVSRSSLCSVSTASNRNDPLFIVSAVGCTLMIQ